MTGREPSWISLTEERSLVRIQYGSGTAVRLFRYRDLASATWRYRLLGPDIGVQRGLTLPGEIQRSRAQPQADQIESLAKQR